MESASDASSNDASSDESSEAEKTTVTVKVSGSTYIYNGSERTLEELKSDMGVLDKNAVIIEVVDDTAVANAVTSLHELLDDIGLSYTDTTAAPAADDTSSEA